MVETLTNYLQIDIWRKDYCTWIEGINTLEEAMFFQCDSDAFMAGVRSVYDSGAEDRVYVTLCSGKCFMVECIGLCMTPLRMLCNVLQGFPVPGTEGHKTLEAKQSLIILLFGSFLHTPTGGM